MENEKAENGEAREYDERPWGNYLVLDEGADYKVKRITVLPDKRLSYQKHQHRREHWFVVQGAALVTLNDKDVLLNIGEAINIEIGDAHRVKNPSSDETLIFIEVQRGSYLGEDDIIRLTDDFGRN